MDPCRSLTIISKNIVVSIFLHSLLTRGKLCVVQVAGDAPQMDRIRAANGLRVTSLGIVMVYGWLSK